MAALNLQSEFPLDSVQLVVEFDLDPTDFADTDAHHPANSEPA